MNISITMTAALRVDLLRRTLESFCKNIDGLSRFSLYINVDPAPANADCELKDIVETVSQFFPVFNVNAPSEPNFSIAVKWLWQQACTDFIFHLEDDWELTKKIELDYLMKMFDNNPELLQIRLRDKSVRNHNNFCLGPSILRKQLYKYYAEEFRPESNPEAQMMHQMHVKHPVTASLKTFIMWPARLSDWVISDIGTLWREERAIEFADINKKMPTYPVSMFNFVRWTK